METSAFSERRALPEMEPIETRGATCDTFRVKLYGKLHFLKRLKPSLSSDVRYREALRKEFETGYRLEHPRLVRYISMSDDGILMEHVDGETLSQWLINHPEHFKSPKNSDKFLHQLLDAVGYLHSHQVLHLDLKPDNIMITHIGGDVKLIDLGCCYTDTFPDTTGHTNAYAAPEQLSGGVVDVRTDIYAIGRILEQLPYHYKYNKVIARCTASSPDDRYQNISDLQDVLSARRTHTLWSVLMLLVVVLASGYFIVTDREQPPAEVADPQKEIIIEKPETMIVREVIQPDKQKEKAAASVEQQAAAPIALDPIKSELSEEEEAFLNQPHLHIATSEEFELYKRKMDEYYREAYVFLNDTINFQRYPSHISYLQRYQEIIQRTREQIEADEWFCPLYKSPMNPISSYTREYKETLERQAFDNSNKLP